LFLYILITFIFLELQNINKKEVGKVSVDLYDDNDDDDDDDHDVILNDDDNPDPCIPRSSSEDETIVLRVV